MTFFDVLHFSSSIIGVPAGMAAGWLLHARRQSRKAARASLARDAAARTAEYAEALKWARADVEAGTTKRDPRQGEAAPCIRNTFSLALGHRLAESARRGDPLSVILARVDNFQTLGERLGSQLAREILDAVGKHLIASVRAMDWVARFDASTFAFLLPNTAHSNALIVAERLRKNVADVTLQAGDASMQLTLSIGTTDFIRGDDSESILIRTEEALAAALRAGGNCIQSRVGGNLDCEATARLAGVASLAAAP